MISDYSTEELQRELDEREKAKSSELKPPEMIVNAKWLGVREMAQEIVDEVAKGTYSLDSDAPEYIFEKVMVTLFGDDFFKWYNRMTY